jgi:PAS domain S-box-containing protein
LLEASLDPLVTIGPDGIITDVNSATEKATGLPREKIIGTDFSEYFTEPDKARVVYKQVFDIGKVVDYELYLKNINGSSIPVLYNVSVYNDNEGQIIGALAVARDISAIKKYEDELVDFKNNLELIVQQKTADLLIANKELTFQTGEKADRAAELIIANIELIHQNEEKEKRAAELIITNKEMVFQNEEKEKRAAELVIANKELYIEREKTEELNNQLESHVTERTAQLESVNKELVFRNEEISYMKNKIELVMNSVGEGVYGINMEGKVTFINPAASHMLGYEHEELLGQLMHIAIHHSHSDGTCFQVEYTSTSVLGDGDRPVRSLCFATLRNESKQ